MSKYGKWMDELIEILKDSKNGEIPISFEYFVNLVERRERTSPTFFEYKSNDLEILLEIRKISKEARELKDKCWKEDQNLAGRRVSPQHYKEENIRSPFLSIAKYISGIAILPRTLVEKLILTICKKFEELQKRCQVSVERMNRIFFSGIFEPLDESFSEERNGWFVRIFPNGDELLACYKDNVIQNGPTLSVRYSPEANKQRECFNDFLDQLSSYDEVIVDGKRWIHLLVFYKNGQPEGDCLFVTPFFSMEGREIEDSNFQKVSMTFRNGDTFKGKQTDENGLEGTYYHKEGDFNIEGVFNDCSYEEEPIEIGKIAGTETKVMTVEDEESFKETQIKVEIDGKFYHIQRWLIRNFQVPSIPVRPIRDNLSSDFFGLSEDTVFGGDIVETILKSCPLHLFRIDVDLIFTCVFYGMIEELISLIGEKELDKKYHYKDLETAPFSVVIGILSLAYESGEEMVKVLISKYRVDPNVCTLDEESKSILYRTIEKKDISLFEFLLEQSDIDLKKGYRKIEMSPSLDENRYMDIKTTLFSPIQKCYIDGNWEMFKKIHDRGADVAEIAVVKSEDMKRGEEDGKNEIREKMMKYCQYVKEGWTKETHMFFPKFYRDYVWILLYFPQFGVDVITYVLSFLPTNKVEDGIDGWGSSDDCDEDEECFISGTEEDDICDFEEEEEEGEEVE